MVRLIPIKTPLAGPDQGILVITAPDVTVQGLELSGATGESESGIRLAAPGLTTIRGCHIHGCDDGILGGGVRGSVPGMDVMGSLLVEDTLVEDCGVQGEGQSHNIYVSDRLTLATFTRVTSRGVCTGHLLKSRAVGTVVTGGDYLDTKNASLIFDFPEGGACVIDGATAEKGAKAENVWFLGFGEEVVPVTSPMGPTMRNIPHSLTIKNCTWTNRQTVAPSGEVLTRGLLINWGSLFRPSMLRMLDCTLVWPAARVEGLKDELEGYVARGAIINGVTVKALEEPPPPPPPPPPPGGNPNRPLTVGEFRAAMVQLRKDIAQDREERRMTEHWDLQAAIANNTVPFTFAEIRQVLANIEGENDGPDWHWVVELHDGRFCYLVGGCDYTGWD